MATSERLPSRLIGELFVERGLISETQLHVGLAMQSETGQLLGQILVARFGVARSEVASILAEQWARALGPLAEPDEDATRRRLGEIFLERGFVSEAELERALERQRETGERVGEALIADGVISKFELAGALGEQTNSKPDVSSADPATVVPLQAREHVGPVEADRNPDSATLRTRFRRRLAKGSADPDAEHSSRQPLV